MDPMGLGDPGVVVSSWSQPPKPSHNSHKCLVGGFVGGWDGRARKPRAEPVLRVAPQETTEHTLIPKRLTVLSEGLDHARLNE